MSDEQMDVVLDRTRSEQRTRRLPQNTADVCVQIVAKCIGDKAFTILRRENEMNQDLGKGLWHGRRLVG